MSKLENGMEYIYSIVLPILTILRAVQSGNTKARYSTSSKDKGPKSWGKAECFIFPQT